MTLIWFTNKPDPALMFEVQQAGHQCVQVSSEGLVKGVVAQYPDSVVLVGADISHAQAHAIQQHYLTIHLTTNTKARDLLFELSHWPGAGQERVQ